MIFIRTDDATGFGVQWGGSAFSDAAPSGQTDQELTDADNTDVVLIDTYGVTFCKVVSGRIVADELDSAKSKKVQDIRDNTDALIGQGAVWNGLTYMSTDKGRFDVLGIFTVGVLAASPGFFPKKVTTTDGLIETEFADAAAFSLFFNQMMGTYSYWQETGQVLRQSVNDATTLAEVAAVEDDRTWPAPAL